MKLLRFVAIDESLVAASQDSPAALQKVVGADVAAGYESIVPILEQTIAYLATKPRSPEWGCYLVIDDDVGQAVGTCGYKGGPGEDGFVEIAYYSFPPYEGRGYATAMAAELLRRAGHRRVLAHTLPERNASCRVLEKCGFVCTGEVIDPEDGPVWRWVNDAGHTI